MQRNFIAWYLNGSRGGVLKDAALVAFISPEQEDWRFSFVKMEYKFVETPKGNIKAKEEFTPARRYSFLVGANENSHTAQRSLYPILMDDEHNPLLDELEDAFSIEKVTKEFFEKYRELFLKTKDALDKIIETDKNIKSDFNQKGVNSVDFAKKLLGQIVFLYFLQKKGWFGVERDADWGTGPKNFLRTLFEKKIADHNNFFNDILEPLFYEALANERTADFYSRFNCKIPFLNGGLFDPINEYDWVHTDILLPDELFSNSIKTKEGDIGTGILDVFDRYNFTVKEDEPLEKEVAVDPEMLGKVFENLLEVKDRKSKGTYYTPREIVHYMCQESLANYLATELSSVIPSPASGGINSARNLKEDIETLIKYGETSVEHDAMYIQKKSKDANYKGRYDKAKLPNSIEQNAKLIDEKLASTRVCDPAIGSGAFLVGMMNEIIRTRNALTSYIGKDGVRTPYNFKRHAIQNCLYGVDIDPGAIEIAKLRLWLSLVVDEEDIKHIKPLPNLDYKIMQGNSLLEEFEGIKLFNEKLIGSKPFDNGEQIKNLKEKQSQLQKEYFQLHNTGKLTGIKKYQLETELQKSKDLLKHLTKLPETVEKQESLVYSTEVNKKAIELRKLHQEFFNAFQKSRKDKLREKIEELERDLIEATLKEQNKESSLEKLVQFKKSNIKPFFLWKLNFEDVFYQKGGFDVVIANPPYVRQEGIKDQKELLRKQGYEVYNSTSDLYTYFYEKSYQLLKDNGIFCFISSNKFMRAQYGEKLRRFLKEKTTLNQIIDFGGHKVFETATVDTCIVLFTKEAAENNNVKVLNVTEDFKDNNDMAFHFFQKAFSLPQSKLASECWTLADDEVLNLKEKIERIGVPLKDWNLRICFGLKTGFNKAFIIDEKTKNELIKKDLKSREIIKPILRGKDIYKWGYNFADQWLILIPSGWTKQKTDLSRLREEKAFKIFQTEYPAVSEYLKSVGEAFSQKGINPQKRKGLFNRDDQGNYWWELRDCDYYPEFEKEKLVYRDIGDKLSFAYEPGKMFTNNTVYFLNSGNKYLLAVLNSLTLDFYYRQISSQLGNAALRAFTIYIEQLPVPEIPENYKRPFISLVDKILTVTKDEDYLENPVKQAKVKEYQRQIDKIVYKLYALTPEEIEIVERVNFNH